ncbi:MAG: LamG-like jellyroll fold domain-containing protein [Verrucomicrobiota bacterium]
MNTYTNQVREGFRLIYVVACLAIACLPPEVTAKPRPARPVLPEGESFLYRANELQTNFVADSISNSVYLKSVYFAESWSGTALQMMGNTASRCIIPAQGTRRPPNFSPNSGSIRLWFAPVWSSSSLGGQGPGTHARVLEIAQLNTRTHVGFALYFDPDGNTIYGTAYRGDQAVELIRATVSLENGVWHQFGLVYGPDYTALALDGQMIATNLPMPTLATDLDHWVCFLGTDKMGQEKLHGQLDEIYFFPFACKESQFTWDYQAQSPLATMGPVTVQESLAQYRTLRRHRGPQRAEENGAPSLPGDFGPTNTSFTYTSDPLTNLYLLNFTYGTNLALSLCNTNRTNGAYDVFATTNLVPVTFYGTATNFSSIAWVLLSHGEAGQTNFVITNAAVPYQYFLAASNEEDDDGDGLSNAYEKLVSKTSPTSAYTSGDTNLTDYMAIMLGANPRVRHDRDTNGLMKFSVFTPLK